MIKIKIIFSISGDKLDSEQLLKKFLDERLTIGTYFSPDDLNKYNQMKFGFGYISFMHPMVFSNQENIEDYEATFINFLLDNYSFFSEFGAKDFQFFHEVYYDDDQCNFEIFNSKILTKIGHINISMPVSVYHLTKSEFEDLS